MKPRLGRLSFFGRAEELRTLHALFGAEERRVVTLCGPPGAGKTRLAHRFGDLWAGGGGRVTHCDLTSARTGEDVVCGVASALGLKLLGAQAMELEVERLGHLMAEAGEILVILDNFEQLAEHAAATVGVWQELAPDVRWLLTSRIKLHLKDEVNVELSGLQAEDAAALFIERARLCQPDFELAPQEHAALAELLLRLDSMPLCIELAAARANLLSPVQMLALIGRRFELLRTPEGAATQQTLLATIEWSWNLLSRSEQQLLAQCSVFRGRFSLAAVQAVVQAPAAGARADAAAWLDGLQALHERSLLRVLGVAGEPDAQCFGLYESIRDFAAERLRESHMASDVERRHADYYLARGDELGRDLIGGPPQERVDAAARDLANYYDVRDRFARIDPTRSVRALLIIGAVLCRRASFELLRQLLDEAVEASAQGVDPEWRAAALCARGRMLGLRGFWGLAAQDFTQALGCVQGQGQGQEAKEGRITYLLNTAYCNLGDPAAARPYVERTVALAHKTAECELLALARYAVGKLHLSQGQRSEASSAFLEAATLFDTLPQRRGKALALGNLSIALEASGQLDEARHHLLQALEIFRELDDQVLEDKLLCGLAQILAEQGLQEEAEQLFARVWKRARAHGDRELVARVAIGRARAALHAASPALARQHLATALSTARLTQCPPLENRIAELMTAAQEPGPRPVRLSVTPGCYSIELDGGQRIDLARRPALRRLMAALLDARRATPGVPLSAELLFAAGWPGERARFESSIQRVYTAIYSLRRFGLEPVLLSRDGGYLLDPTVAVDPSAPGLAAQ